MLQIEYDLKQNAKGCLIGILVMTGIDNFNSCNALEEVKRKLERELGKEYGQMTRQELKRIHPMAVYVGYYKKFGYTYHVLSQLESVAHGKRIPNVSALVEAMFMAELKNMLLTAGHDLEKIKQPLLVKVSTGSESYLGINGKSLTTTPGDIMIRDGESVISSILKGPDSRTRISATTRQVLFTIYAPEGIPEDMVLRHMNDIEAYVRVFSPGAETQVKRVTSRGRASNIALQS